MHRYVGSIWLDYRGPTFRSPPLPSTCRHCGADLDEGAHRELGIGNACSNLRLHHEVARLRVELARALAANDRDEQPQKDEA